MIAACAGSRILYGGMIFNEAVSEIVELVLKIGLFNLGVLTPAFAKFIYSLKSLK